jgi:HK97 family phage portal protein
VSLVRAVARNLSNQRVFSGPWGDPYRDGTIPPPTYDGAGSGQPVNEQTALSLIDAYACVDLLVADVMQLPLNELQRGAGPGGVRTPVDPPSQVVAQPDPEIERWDYMSRVVTSLALRGNSYSAVLSVDPKTFLPTALRAIHPDDIDKKRDKRNGRIFYRLSDGSELSKEQVVHIPLVTLAGSLIGLSPIDCARRGIRLATNTETFGDRWFTDGASPSSVLETDQAMDDGQARRTVAKFMAAHQGRRRPALLSGGLKWKPITITPEESQFLQSRGLNTAQIARIWRIMPHMIGDTERSTSWGSGLEEMSIGHVVHTIAPYLVRIETAFTRLTPVDRIAKFNAAALLRGNTKDRYAAYAVGRQWGWLSVNDIRRLEDLPPIAGGDVYLQPLNMVDASLGLIPKGMETAGGRTGEKPLDVLELTQALQRIYLAVNGNVISADEAREIVNRGGADLPIPFPGGGNGPS